MPAKPMPATSARCDNASRMRRTCLAFPGVFKSAGDSYARSTTRGAVWVEAVAFVVVGVDRGVAGAVAPVFFEVVDPGMELDEVFAADVVDAGAAIVEVGSALDEVGASEDAEVLADERLALL